MTRLRLANSGSRRRGFTLIELLVVISIIAVLLSLIAPAVQNARRAARKMECQNHMHQLAIAVNGFASTNNGTLPPLVGTMRVGATDVVHNWIIPLLPLLDESALYKEIRATGFTDATVLSHNIKVLTCPDDAVKYGTARGLSYAANAGYISHILWGPNDTSSGGYAHYLFNVDYDLDDTFLSGNAGTNQVDTGDSSVAISTGVFWRQAGTNYSAADPRVTLDSIGAGDGVTQTVMFAENLNSADWISPTIATCAFGIAVNEATPVDATPAGPLWGAATGWSTSSVPATFGDVGSPVASPTVTYYSAKLNSLPLTGSGIPRPSSNHLGAVNFVFCDGSVKSINENLDSSVYARLVTPDGKTYSQPLLSGNSY